MEGCKQKANYEFFGLLIGSGFNDKVCDDKESSGRWVKYGTFKRLNLKTFFFLARYCIRNNFCCQLFFFFLKSISGILGEV